MRVVTWNVTNEFLEASNSKMCTLFSPPSLRSNHSFRPLPLSSAFKHVLTLHHFDLLLLMMQTSVIEALVRWLFYSFKVSHKFSIIFRCLDFLHYKILMPKIWAINHLPFARYKPSNIKHWLSQKAVTVFMSCFVQVRMLMFEGVYLMNRWALLRFWVLASYNELYLVM